MFKVFGYDDLCRDFEFFVYTEEEAQKFEDENLMCVVCYKKADPEIQSIVDIGKKVNLVFESGSHFYVFLDKVMDRLEGKEMYANDMLFLVNYKNELMEKNSDY